jgi:DNA repair protein RecO
MEAIVLKRTAFAETNEIITLYTRELGKIRAVARAVKSAKSKLSFGLQTLFLTDVELVKSKNMHIVTGVKPIDTFRHIRDHEHRIAYALYATELVLRSTPDEEPNPKLFDYIASYFHHLDHADHELSAFYACLGFFTLRILSMIGYGLDLTHCAVCGKPLVPDTDAAEGSTSRSSGRRIGFSNFRTGLVCNECTQRVGDAFELPNGVYAFLLAGFEKNFEDQDHTDPDITNPTNTNPNLARQLFMFGDAFASHMLERELKAGIQIKKTK